MADIIHCGESPKPCGKFSDAVTEQDFQLRIPMGQSVNGNCYYTYQTVTQQTETVSRLVYLFGSGKSTLDKSAYVNVNYTRTYDVVSDAIGSKSYQLYPFFVGVKGHIKLSYNENGHLIATLTNLYSALLTTDGSFTYQGVFPFCTAGDFGYALIATLNPTRPADGDSKWNKCLGGWWSGSVSCGSGNCYAGCTNYKTAVFNDVGTKYAHTGAHPTRYDTNLVWDLGEIDNPDNYNVFIYGMEVRGNCSNARFTGKGSSSSLNFTVPPMNICPPVLNGITHERDICEEKITTTLNVTIPDLGTGTADLVIRYEAINRESDWHDSWASTKTVSGVSENTTISVTLDENLIPDTTYFFRLYLKKNNLQSDVITICDQVTPYLPAVGCLVPELSEDECELLIAGECLDELTAETAEVCC